jgi:hypothetical protein
VNDLDARLRDSIADWNVATAPDWEDVLRRARERRRLGAAPTAALLLALALLLAVPALGVGGHLSGLLGRADRPGLRLGAAISTPDGARVGSLSMRTSRLFVPIPRGRRTVAHPVPHPFRPRGSVFPLTFPVIWALELAPAAQGGDARLVRTGVDGRRRAISRLCTACPGRTGGRVRLARADLDALFGGRLSIVVTSGGTTARGVVRFRPWR